jgi:hypothetical protein
MALHLIDAVSKLPERSLTSVNASCHMCASVDPGSGWKVMGVTARSVRAAFRRAGEGADGELGAIHRQVPSVPLS